MDIKELQKLSGEELTRILQEKREYIRDLRFKISQNQWKKVRDARVAKKTIARILTLLKQREVKA